MAPKRPLALPTHVERRTQKIPIRRKKKPKPFYKKFKANIEIKIFFIVGILTVMGIISVFYKNEFHTFLSTTPGISTFYLAIRSEILGRSLLGLFYIGFLGSLFFVTIPVEASFFIFAKEGYNLPLLVIVLVYSALLGHLLNYAFGHIVGRRVLKIVIDKKTHSKYSKSLRKLGIFLIFLMNALPLPSQILSVVLGSLRYRFGRFLFFVMCGQLVKYTFLMVLQQNLF